MKAKINSDVKPEFTPFQLVIDIESVDEARELWHRLVWANSKFKNIWENQSVLRPTACNTTDLWATLNNYMVENNLKK